MPRVSSYSNLRANLAKLLDSVSDDLEPLIVERRGKKDVALIDAGELSSIMETFHLLKSPANARHLFAALEEDPVPLTLEEFLAGQWKNSVQSSNLDSSPTRPGGSSTNRKTPTKSKH